MCGNCGYNHKLFVPLTLIFLGALIMMVNVGVLPSGLWRLWPVVLVIIGLIGLSGSCEECKMGGGKAAPKSSAKAKKSSKKR